MIKLNFSNISTTLKAFCIVAMMLTVGIVAAQHNHDNHASGDRISSKGMAVMDSKAVFVPFEFTRRAVGDDDVLIEILYAGICHSDVHQVLSDWRNETYPMVPGHEIVGRIAKVGRRVTRFRVGDYAGVGCMVNSCGQCGYCRDDKEQHCEIGTVYTYASKDIYHNNEITYGGYSNNIVVPAKFVIKIPSNAPLEKIAPLFCAGITTYSPIKYAGVKKNDRVAIAGFGGLGHMALQYLVKRGAKVTVFDITDDKEKEALTMGATKYINIKNIKEPEKLKDSFRFIFSTIPAKYDPTIYVKMLEDGGELIILGVPPTKDTPQVDIATLVFLSRRKVWGSVIGGIKETQEMLDYSVKNKIYPRVELIEPSQITETYKKITNNSGRFRYVIDMRKLK